MEKSFVRPAHSWLLISCLVMLMFVVAACGGSGSSDSASSYNSGSNAGSGNTSAGSSNSGSSSNTSSSSSGKSSVMTVMVREKKDPGKSDMYFFDPTSIKIKKGDTITIQNESDELQDIDQGDAQKAGVDAAIPINQSATMTFNNTGTFTLKSEKGATITVTVQ